jgi:hypothetical protein
MEELGLSPQTACPDLCSLGKVSEGRFVPGDEDIPWILSFRNGREMKSIRKFGWNILDAVDGKVNPFLEQGFSISSQRPFPPSRLKGHPVFYPSGFDLDQGNT